MRAKPIPGIPEVAGQKIIRRHGQRQSYVPFTSIEQGNGTNTLFADAVSTVWRGGLHMPADWVPDTDIVLKLVFVQIGTAGSPTAVLRSWVAAWANAEDVGTGIDNIEANVNVNTVCTLNIMAGVARSFAGSLFGSADIITWAVQRLGADANDTVNATLHMRGAWMEYTSWLS